MKKILTVSISSLLLTGIVAMCFPAFAAMPDLSVIIGGVKVEFPDAKPFIDQNGRVQIPVSAVAAALGAEVLWDEATQTVTVEKDGLIVKIMIGSAVIYANGEEITMDTAALITDGRTYVPVSYLARALGYTVSWNAEANTAQLSLAAAALPENSASSGFTFELLGKMPQDKNYMFSPFSLKMALAMAANGASGATSSEILNALGIDDIDSFNSITKDFIGNINRNEKVEFNIANSIWYNTDHFVGSAGFSESYKNVITQYFAGEANEINSQNGAKIINDWIAEKTNDKIKDVVNDSSVRENLSFLVNTIYFKGDWAEPFKAEATKEDIFTERGGAEKTATFMNSTGSYRYFENDDFQILAKPYMDENIEMYLLLPKNDNPPTAPSFENAVKNMAFKRVMLKLPKFKTENLHENIVTMLKSMGVSTAFDPLSADFRGMYSEEQLENAYISNILQKTFIEVDEKGTEAAAATVLMTGTTSVGAVDDPVMFYCDRPFYYFIRDNVSGEILFMGEYAFVEQ